VIFFLGTIWRELSLKFEEIAEFVRMRITFFSTSDGREFLSLFKVYLTLAVFLASLPF